MNKTIRMVLAALVIGLGSTVAYAGGQGQVPKPVKPHKPGKQGCGDKCDGTIDIKLKVEKHCDLEFPDNTLNLAQGTLNGNEVWTDSLNFNVNTNAYFRVNYVAPDVLNGTGGATIPVTVETSANGTPYSSGDLLETTSATFGVTATVTAHDYRSAPADDYSNVYTFNVTF